MPYPWLTAYTAAIEAATTSLPETRTSIGTSSTLAPSRRPKMFSYMPEYYPSFKGYNYSGISSPPYSSSSSSSESPTLIAVVCVLAGLGFTVWIAWKLRKWRARPGATNRVVWTVQQVPNFGASDIPEDTVSMKSANESLFWAPTCGQAFDISTEVVCTICLSNIGESSPVAVGKSRCCKSWFHRDCTALYWASAEEVKCPNCRHEIV
jgi:hypothetical protein